MPDALPVRWSAPAVVLVATDLTDLDRLMPHGLALAAASGAQLVVFHAIPQEMAVRIDGDGHPVYDATEAIHTAERSLKPWCQVAEARKIRCSAVVREGEPAEQIGETIRLLEADILLVGTRNPAKKRKLELGFVAEQVLRSVNIPVITVGPEAHLKVQADDRPPVVLHATTLRETSRPSAVLACKFAAQRGGRLVLLHVAPDVEEMRRAGKPVGNDSEQMDSLRQLAGVTDCNCSSTALPHPTATGPAEPYPVAPRPIELRIVHGNHLIEILATAAECHASLIVLDIGGLGAFDRLSRERAILQVLAHARCPVMTLRTPCAVTVEQPEPAAAAGRR